MTVFTPQYPIRLYDILKIRQEKIAPKIATECFQLKTSFSDSKCEKYEEILEKYLTQQQIQYENVSQLLTGEKAFDFWAGVVQNSQISLKDAAEHQNLDKISKFNSCAHAIYVPIVKALGDELNIVTPQLKAYNNDFEMLNAFVLIGDTVDQMKKKINKAFCPEKEDNGLLNTLQVADDFLQSKNMSFSQIKESFIQGSLSAKDLKDLVIEFLEPYCSNEEFSKECQAVWKMK